MTPQELLKRACDFEELLPYYDVLESETNVKYMTFDSLTEFCRVRGGEPELCISEWHSVDGYTIGVNTQTLEVYGEADSDGTVLMLGQLPRYRVERAMRLQWDWYDATYSVMTSMTAQIKVFAHDEADRDFTAPMHEDYAKRFGAHTLV